MIITRLSGGLGNQMFQYAFGRSLSLRLGAELKLDTGFFKHQPAEKTGHVSRTYDLDIYSISPLFATEKEVDQLTRRTSVNILDKGLNKLFGAKRSYLREPHFHFSEKAYGAPDNTYVSGYWQTEKYFIEESDIIREDFSFNEAMSEKARLLLQQINNVNSVCINVRRGDFVTNSFHGSYGADYFKRAESILDKKTNKPVYFIFSDDIEWCEKNLRFDGEMFFVSHEFAGRKFQDYLRLMSSCNHFIIPNSSFAWWAVWFNKNPDKIVIAPQRWFNDPTLNTRDIAPLSWIRI